MDLENLWYELFPFVYGIGGIVAFLVRPDSLLLRISGVLLFAAGITIMRLRWTYRRAVYVAPPLPVRPAAPEPAPAD